MTNKAGIVFNVYNKTINMAYFTIDPPDVTNSYSKIVFVQT